MELRHLRYFVAVAEEKNITRAAAKLNLSQPPLSRQIRDLEEELGAALFTRTQKGIRLNELGAVFLFDAKAILDKASLSAEKIRALAATSNEGVRIGHAHVILSGILPGLLRLIRSHSPRMRVKLSEESIAALVTKVVDRTLDAAFSPKPRVRLVPKICYEEICCVRPGVMVPEGHRFAQAAAIAPRELLGEPLVVPTLGHLTNYHRFLRTVFRLAKGSPRIAMECDSGSELLLSAAAGYGVAVMFELPKRARPGLKFVPFVGGPPNLSLGILYRRGALTPEVTTLVESARQFRSRLSRSA